MNEELWPIVLELSPEWKEYFDATTCAHDSRIAWTSPAEQTGTELYWLWSLTEQDKEFLRSCNISAE